MRVTTRTLFGGYVCGAQASVNQERSAVHIARFVARQEQRGIRNLPRLCQAPHRQMNATALVCAGSLRKKTHEEWRLHWPRTQRVDAHALACELHGELAAHRQDRA